MSGVTITIPAHDIEIVRKSAAGEEITTYARNGTVTIRADDGHYSEEPVEATPRDGTDAALGYKRAAPTRRRRP